MERDFVKRFIKKDGTERMSIYRDDYADNPRDNTDEPLHCEDWSREYSIMTKQERASKSSSARGLLEYMIRNYGDFNKIIRSLVSNGKNVGTGKVEYGTALVYDRTRRGWVLIGDINCYFGNEIENGWYEYNFFDGKKDDIDLCAIIEEATDDAIDYFATNFMTDEVKMMSYSFGYYGGISFSHEVSTDSEGICWLEKDELLAYIGRKEDYWNGKSLEEIEFLLDELRAWSEGDVYGFVAENCIKSKIHKEYTNVDKDAEDYEEEEWEEAGSCWGYYGELDKAIGNIFADTGLKKEEYVEEDV